MLPCNLEKVAGHIYLLYSVAQGGADSLGMGASFPVNTLTIMDIVIKIIDIFFVPQNSQNLIYKIKLLQFAALYDKIIMRHNLI